MGRSRNSRPEYIDPDQFKHAGGVLSSENQQVAQGILLGKLAEMEAEDALIATTALMQGQSPAAKEVTIVAYVMETKAGKQVTVSTKDAMDAIISNGGQFISETTTTRKV